MTTFTRAMLGLLLFAFCTAGAKSQDVDFTEKSSRTVSIQRS